MPFVLASLFSRKFRSTGLMAYDLEQERARYVQLVDLSALPIRNPQLRSISIAGTRLYVLAPCALLVFKMDARLPGPHLVLERTICRPEWITGGKEQGNLHAIFVCPERERIYLSFNAQNAIDILDLDGNLLERRYLWDIAPNLFSLPPGPVNKDFNFGVVRQLFYSERRQLMLTASYLNGTKDSAVINFDTGRTALEMPSQPVHGGLVHKNILYTCAAQRGAVTSFAWPEEQEAPNHDPIGLFTPLMTDPVWEVGEQRTRGIGICNGRLVCGVRCPGKPKPDQISPRMVDFDMQTGNQLKTYWLPSFQGFEEPRIHDLLPLSEELTRIFAGSDEPRYFRGEFQFEPVWIVRDAPHKKAESFSPEVPSSAAAADIFTVTEGHAREMDQAAATVDPDSLENGVSSLAVENPNLPAAEPARATVVFENVGVCFIRAARKFLSLNKTLRRKKTFWALNNVSFTVYEGETLGVIGRNGSGKSTLSMVCGGVLVPDSGRVTAHGKVQLLALNVGFKNELSGRDNVFICGSLLGLSKKQIQERMNDIEAFAELGEFMEEPVRTYSSGMRSRLGFAVATAVHPDILVLDEIMATGDKAFQDKAMRRMRDMSRLARSVIVVSHNPGQLRKMATRVLWLDKGRMVMLGDPREVLNAYDNFCQNPSKWMDHHPELAIQTATEVGERV